MPVKLALASIRKVLKGYDIVQSIIKKNTRIVDNYLCIVYILANFDMVSPVSMISSTKSKCFPVSLLRSQPVI